MRRLLALLCIVLALAGCGRAPREVETERATVGPIEEAFEEQAETRLSRTYTVAMPTTARIRRIESEPGDRVRKGQVLVRLDLHREQRTTAEARHEVEQVRAQMALNDDRRVEQAERAQAQAQVDAQRSTLRALEARVRVAQARHAQAVTDLQRMEQLWAQRYVTAKDRDDARVTETTSRLELSQARADADAQRQSLAAAGERVRMVDEAMRRKSLQHEVLARQVERTEERVEQSRHEAQVAEVASPIDGLVLERITQGPAELPGGTSLLRLGTMADLEVMSEVLTEDAVRLAIGGKVCMDAGRGCDLEGRVHHIEPEGFTRRSSLGVEQKRVRVIVRLCGPPPGWLGAGYRLRARFLTARKADVVLVPRFALLQGTDDTLYVLTVDDGVVHRRTVRTGLRSDLVVEIVAGLRKGDVVVAMPDPDLTDGTRVSAKTRQP